MHAAGEPPTNIRYLIVNADDFGLSGGVNEGIVAAHENGIVTSASLMVRAPAVRDAVACAASHPDLSLGLHLELADWVFRDGEWKPRYEVVPGDDAEAVRAEAVRQLESFRLLVGRDPTHIDSHQHQHREQPLRDVVLEMGRRLGVPIRSLTPTIMYSGEFYGQTGKGSPYPEAISVPGLLRTLANLPIGITELGCHPGWDANLDDAYGIERMREVQTLCDPQIQAAFDRHGIRLCSFSAIPRTAP